MVGCLDNEILNFEARPPKLWLTSQQSPNPGEQLAKRKRFGQIIVRAGVESVDTIINRGASGQHQHRRCVAPRPQLAADFEAITNGKQDIEQDQIVIINSTLIEGRITIARDIDRISMLAQSFR